MKMRYKIDGMLIATFLTTIFYSSTYPYIHKELMTVPFYQMKGGGV